MRCLYVAAPIAQPVRTSFGQMNERPMILVILEDEDGRTGIGESWANFPAWLPQERLATLREGLRPLVLGETITSVPLFTAQTLQSLLPLARQWGAPGPIYQAISAIDIALWDLKGKEQQQPVSLLLGGDETPRVPVYASGLGPRDPVGTAQHLYEAGVRLLKLKIGFGQERDRANLEALRASYPDATLAVDANRAWDLATAVSYNGLLDEYECAWLEEPLAEDDIAALRHLGEELVCPVAAGENMYGLKSFEEAFNAKALGLAQPDVTKVGGISEAFNVMKHASKAGIPFAPHFLGGAVGHVATLHCFAAAPGGRVVELDANPNPLLSDLLRELPEVSDGQVSVPTEAGLGVSLDWDVVDRYTRAAV